MKAKEYGEINKLVSQYSKISNALETVEAKIKERQLRAANSTMPQYAGLKTRLGEIEAELRKLADENYDELFPEEKKRSHKTPFGSLSYRKTSHLDFEDEAQTVLRIEAACEAELIRAKAADEDPLFRATELVRVRCAPNIEALELLGGETLRQFGITRVQEDNFKVKPFDMKTDKPGKKEEVAA